MSGTSAAGGNSGIPAGSPLVGSNLFITAAWMQLIQYLYSTITGTPAAATTTGATGGTTAPSSSSLLGSVQAALTAATQAQAAAGTAQTAADTAQSTANQAANIAFAALSRPIIGLSRDQVVRLIEQAGQAPVVFQPGIVLTGSAVVVVNQSGVLTSSVFSNSTSSPITLEVSVNRAAGGSSVLIPGAVVEAGTSYVSPEMLNLVLAAGDSISALGAGLHAVISGYQTA